MVKPEWFHGKASKSQQDTVDYILWRREQLLGDERGRGYSGGCGNHRRGYGV